MYLGCGKKLTQEQDHRKGPSQPAGSSQEPFCGEAAVLTTTLMSQPEYYSYSEN